MLNKCIVVGIMISKEVKITTTATGKRKINFALCNVRDYKEGGQYKSNTIFCDCWRDGFIDLMLEKIECGARICVVGEFKVDTSKDENGYYRSRCYLAVSEIYPVTYKNYNPGDDQKDEDYGADVAQINWGDQI